MSRSKMISFLLISLFTTVALHAQSHPGNYTSYTATGNVVTIHADSSALRLVFYRPNIVRVDYISGPSAAFPLSLVVLPDSNRTVAVGAVDSDSSISFSTSGLEVICDKYPLRLSFYDASNRLLVAQPSVDGLSASDSARTANFLIQPGEHFYGTGERGTSFDLRGLEFDSYNQQHGGYPTGGLPPAMNVNIPFIISSNRYGIYFEDTYKGHFDIGHTSSDVLSYSAAGGELSYYLISDPSDSAILSDYTWLTGRAPLLPKWAYGYIQSKFGYHNYQEAESTIQTFRSDSIPCDAIVLDLYWFKNMGDLAWNTAAWPNPDQITAKFLSQGFKTIVITEPYIVQGSLNFQAADQNGYLAKDSLGKSYILENWWSCSCNAGLLDITDPAAQSWWWSKYSQIFQTGVSGIWTDLGEPERDYPGMRFQMGSDARVHNIYDFLWAETLFSGFNSSFPNARLFNLTRSGYAGIQRFGAVTWSGDVAKTFDGLAVQLPILLNMSMSGITYHNSDIGGFTGTQPTTAELYTRWMEFGAFCPVMRAHGYDGLGGTEPWVFGAATEKIVKKMISLRYALMPYNYTMAHEAYESGIPIVRPLAMEFRGDPNTADESSAYMWGKNFLVAPVVKSGETSRTFYLPQGKWIDYWSDEVYDGGQTVTVPAPIDEIPLFVRAGSIIPMQPVEQYTGERSADTIMLAIYPGPGSASSFTLYEDDGTTRDYQEGSFATTDFLEEIANGTGGSVMRISLGRTAGSYAGKPLRRTYICEVHKISSEPRSVILGGVRMPEALSRDSLAGMASGYFYAPSGKVLYVKVPANADSSYSIEVDSVAVTGVRGTGERPSGYGLEQNYPNPFNPSTSIMYSLSERSFVTLRVYDVLGREVATLVDGHQGAGRHTEVFDGRGLTSGVYFYSLSAGNFRATREMLLLK